MFGQGRESHLDVREGSVGLTEPLVGVGKPTLRSGMGREAHPKVQEGSGVVA